MIDTDTFRQIALSFPETEEHPHFNRAAFKVVGKRIFATLLEENQTANMVLSIADQQVFCSFNEKFVYPVPNKFGLQGWTTFELKSLPVELISDALCTAYQAVLKVKPKKTSVKNTSIKKLK